MKATNGLSLDVYRQVAGWAGQKATRPATDEEFNQATKKQRKGINRATRGRLYIGTERAEIRRQRRIINREILIQTVKYFGGIQEYGGEERGSIYFRLPSGFRVRLSDHEPPGIGAYSTTEIYDSTDAVNFALEMALQL